MALVCSTGFLIFNNKKIDQLSRDRFKEILFSVFPECKGYLEDHEDFLPGEFALYNLSIIVADSHKYITQEEGFEVLKEKVSYFYNAVIVDDPG